MMVVIGLLLLLAAVGVPSAKAADFLRGEQRRGPDGSFAPNRTTQVQKGISLLGLTLFALVFIAVGQIL